MRMRSFAIGVATILAIGLVTAPGARAVGGSVGLGASDWTVDVGTGQVSYDLTVSGTGLAQGDGICRLYSCSMSVRAGRENPDGSISEVTSFTPVNPTLPAGTDTAMRGLQASGVTLPEITHLRGKVSGSGGTVYSAWTKVSEAFPDQAVNLSVGQWVVDVDAGQVSYDLTVSGTGLAQGDGICRLYSCSMSVRAGRENPDGSISEVTSFTPVNPTLPAGTWSASRTAQASGATPPEITHLRGKVSGSGGTVYSAWRHVSSWTERDRDYTLAVEVATPLLAAKVALAEDPCQPLVFDHAGPKASGAPDVPDSYEACEAAILAGKPIKLIMAAILAAGGVSAVDLWITGLDDEAPAPAPTPTPSPPPGDPWPRPLPVGPIEDWPALPEPMIDDILRNMNIVGPSTLPDGRPTQEEKRAAVRRCTQLAYVANLSNQTANPCQPAILVPGLDAQQAAAHDLDAITSNPPWVQLHYRPRADSPVTDGWMNSQPACLDKAAGEQCDEYPLRATVESDPTSVSLRKINGDHNGREGVVYGAMTRSCGHEASYKLVPPISRPFMVVPMPQDGAPPSFFLCDTRRVS